MHALAGSHELKVVLVEPEIPANTGNIARLCEVTGAELHLVRPLGFFLSEKHLKRAGMDYLKRVKLVVHDDLSALRTAIADSNHWLFTARKGMNLWDIPFAAGNWLVFGKETAGLPSAWLDESPQRCVNIPMRAEARCLNLSTAAGIGLYEALRRVQHSQA